VPIAQFTRAYFAMNKVLDDASQSLGLGKRAAVVVLILLEADNGQMRTKDVVERFQAWYVSGANTAAKDVSIAKGELFEKDLIVARHGIRNIELTSTGRLLAANLVTEIEGELQSLVDNQADLVLIAQALRDLRPSKPEEALSEIKVPRRPAGSVRGKSKGHRRSA
jgi:hypothetical protein